MGLRDLFIASAGAAILVAGVAAAVVVVRTFRMHPRSRDPFIWIAQTGFAIGAIVAGARLIADALDAWPSSSTSWVVLRTPALIATLVGLAAFLVAVLRGSVTVSLAYRKVRQLVRHRGGSEGWVPSETIPDGGWNALHRTIALMNPFSPGSLVWRLTQATDGLALLRAMTVLTAAALAFLAVIGAPTAIRDPDPAWGWAAPAVIGLDLMGVALGFWMWRRLPSERDAFSILEATLKALVAPGRLFSVGLLVGLATLIPSGSGRVAVIASSLGAWGTLLMIPTPRRIAKRQRLLTNAGMSWDLTTLLIAWNPAFVLRRAGAVPSEPPLPEPPREAASPRMRRGRR